MAQQLQPIVSNSKTEVSWRFLQQLHAIKLSLQQLPEAFPKQFDEVIEPMQQRGGNRYSGSIQLLQELEEKALEYYLDSLVKEE